MLVVEVVLVVYYLEIFSQLQVLRILSMLVVVGPRLVLVVESSVEIQDKVLIL
jgi:hypothetical protein